MNIVMDEDVQKVCEFMQTSMPATKLVGVAKSVAGLAPVLWGTYETQAVDALRLQTATWADGQPKQSAST